jgi:hypothetical protein
MEPRTVEMKMSCGEGDLSRRGRKASVTRAAPRRFTEMHSLRLVVRSGDLLETPALLMRMSSLRCFCVISSTAAWMDEGSVTSSLIGMRFVRFASSGVEGIVRHPQRIWDAGNEEAIAFAVARPRPRVAPVLGVRNTD